MNWHFIPNRSFLRTGVEILLIVAVVAPSAFAQRNRSELNVDTPGLKIDATAGWDGVVETEAPVAFSFLIENESTGEFEGQLWLEDPPRVHEMTLGEIHAGPVSTRRFSAVLDVSEWDRCIATFVSDDKVLWRRELPLLTGRTFSGNPPTVLVVDGGGRRLAFGDSPVTTSPAETESVDTAIPAVQCVSMKPWQVPIHPGPLVVAPIIVFSEETDAESLNDGQWAAVAEWICLGGTAFVHGRTPGVLERIIKLAPLEMAPGKPEGEFTIRELGLGAVHVYDARLFSSAGLPLHRIIADTAAGIGRRHPITEPGQYRRYGIRSYANQNRMWVVAFFGVYTLSSGLVALLLFRRTRRQVAVYTGCVVAAACVCAGLLGAVLQTSTGDLVWTTVTEIGSGGAVQVGRIDVQSAGGRNTQVAVQGHRPDLQFFGMPPQPYYYYGNREPTHWVPFTRQRNQAPGDDNVYEISAPMTPWGRGRLYARAYAPELPRMEFTLQPQSGSRGPSEESWTLNLVNHLPFAISNCQLVICTATQSADRSGNPGISGVPAGVVAGRSGDFRQVTSNGLQHHAFVHELSTVPPGDVLNPELTVRLTQIDNRWDAPLSRLPDELTIPQVTQPGTASAWIVGQLAESPALAIDESRTEFVPQDATHLIVQEIRPEDFPGAESLLSPEQR